MSTRWPRLRFPLPIFLRVVAFVQDKMLVGGILLTHLQNLPCNAHEVAEIEIPAAILF
jgi:hypothetical protein